MAVDIRTDTDEDVPDLGEAYMHCTRCLDEWRRSTLMKLSPKEYARQQTSITKDGRIQVWCTRHEINIAVFSFEVRREYH